MIMVMKYQITGNIAIKEAETMNKTDKILIVIFIGVLMALLSGAYNAQVELSKKRSQDRSMATELVQTVCDMAHNEINKQSEEACGLAQDTTKLEYLCRSNICWVELGSLK
jgi:hypothetical protein